MEHFLLWGRLVLGGALIVVAGIKLTKYADVFSEKLGLGHAFVGMVFLGWVTSLPEMVMSVTSVLLDSPDSVNLAVGNITGSCYFNVFMLALMVLVIRRGAIESRVDPCEMLTATFAMLMMLLVVLALQFAGPASGMTKYGFVRDPLGINVSLFSYLIIILYAYSTWLIYRQDKKLGLSCAADKEAETLKENQYDDWSLGLTAVKSLLGMAVIVAGGIWVAVTADKIGDTYGMSKSIIGTLFMAIISSLPELTTTISAGRMGLYGMAVGNVFGSNIFNVMILGVCDLFLRSGPLFSDAKLEGPKHEIMAIMGLVLSLAFLAGILYRSDRSPARTSWPALIVAALYVLGLVVFFFIGN